MEYITVGEIVKAQGIAGEIKVKTLTDSPERFRKLRVLYLDERPYKVLGLRLDRDFAYLKLQGIDDRNAAEGLRGKFVQIDRVHAVDLEEDEYFIADLIGCEVQDDSGAILGKIVDLSQTGGAVDVIEAISTRGGAFRFPFLRRVILHVDVKAKRFVVDRNALDEVCVYDD